MVENGMDERQRLLSSLPSVDEILKGKICVEWLKNHPRRYVLQAIREVIDSRRKEIIDGSVREAHDVIDTDLSLERLSADIERRIEKLSSYSLRPVINATGIVLHTNLGRSILSERALENIKRVSENYSNLEYDLDAGKRGKRYSHIKGILRDITGAEDAFIVNNNAAAVLLCLNTLSKGKEVIVSRGELIEIGGSFRMPDVMVSSGAILREVGTTNKTHLYDYENAISENTGLILKVHQSNYRIVGFTEEVSIEDLVSLGKRHQIPVMFDLGSGCLIDLKPSGIYNEPVVQEVVKSGADVTTFSGDKLLGGPQGGVIVGRREYIEKIQKNPMTRALRIDKLTLAAFEATLMEYLDEDKAKEYIPTLKMLFQRPAEIRERAEKIAMLLKEFLRDVRIEVIQDFSRAGGGSLPEMDFLTYVVSIKPDNLSVNELEWRLRHNNPPIIARIKEDSLMVDVRTVRDSEIDSLVNGIRTVLSLRA